MPPGYVFAPRPDEVAKAVLATSTWAVLALTLFIELFTQLHARESIAPDKALSPLFKDVFMFHWKEESQHAILDELEWTHHDHGLTAEQRDKSVDEFIALVAAVDGSCRRRPRKTAATSSRAAAGTIGGRQRSPPGGRSSPLIAGNTSFPARSTLTSSRLSSLITDQQSTRITTALSALH